MTRETERIYNIARPSRGPSAVAELFVVYAKSSSPGTSARAYNRRPPMLLTRWRHRLWL